MQLRGGECQRGNIDLVLGYSEKSPIHRQATSYLEPNSQCMQQTSRGVYPAMEKPESLRLPRTYLEPNRNSMQKPIEGLSQLASAATQPTQYTLIRAPNKTELEKTQRRKNWRERTVVLAPQRLLFRKSNLDRRNHPRLRLTLAWWHFSGPNSYRLHL